MARADDLSRSRETNRGGIRRALRDGPRLWVASEPEFPGNQASWAACHPKQAAGESSPVGCFRAGETPPEDDWSGISVAERIDAVWELTRRCLEWNRTGTDEPRLQRFVSRVQRAALGTSSSARTHWPHMGTCARWCRHGRSASEGLEACSGLADGQLRAVGLSSAKDGCPSVVASSKDVRFALRGKPGLRSASVCGAAVDDTPHCDPPG